MITNKHSWSLGPLPKSEQPCPNKSLALCGSPIPTHPSDPFLGTLTSPSASHIPYRAIQIAAAHHRPADSICSSLIAHQTRDTTFREANVSFGATSLWRAWEANRCSNPSGRFFKIAAQSPRLARIRSRVKIHTSIRVSEQLLWGNKIEAGLGSPSTIHNRQSRRRPFHSPNPRLYYAKPNFSFSMSRSATNQPHLAADLPPL